MQNKPTVKKSSKTKKYYLYLKAAKASLVNAKFLNEEAELLIGRNRFARGFALSVLSLEESSKAFLFRCISLNLLNEGKTVKLIRDHEKKLYQSEVILSAAFKMAQFFLEIMKKIFEISNNTEQLDNLEKMSNSGLMELVRHGIERLKHIHGKKLDSLYVNVRDGKIIDPNQFTNKETKQILEFANMQNEILTNIMGTTDDMFIKLWKVLTLSPFEEDKREEWSGMEEFLQLVKDMK